MHKSVLKKVAEDRLARQHKLPVVMFSLALLLGCISLAGCTGPQQAINTNDFVEIENPFYDAVTNDNPKIWVPRKSLESGLPRGKELLRKGYEAVAGKPAAVAGVVIDAATPPTGRARTRLLIAEAGDLSVGGQLGKFLTRGCIVRPVARPSAGVPVNETEQLAYLATLASQPAGGPVLLVTKPEGIKPGARLKADLYDIRGPILIRTFTLTVPAPINEQTPEDALFSALKGLADATLSSLEWFPWYGRVISVSGDRVYIDAGAESGLKTGQKLVVYRDGEAIKGIGFAPGEHITTFPLKHLVGPDGAYGTTVDAPKVQPGDYVELEK